MYGRFANALTNKTFWTVFFICLYANYLVSLPKIENIMPYTITIADNNPQALHLVRYLKTLDFVKVTKQKELKYSQEVLDASKVLKMTPEEIVEAAKDRKAHV